MKVTTNVIILFSILASTHSTSIAEIKQQIEECSAELKISIEQIINLRKTESPEANCFAACLMKKRGSMKDGKIDTEQMLKILKQFRVLNSERNEEKFSRCAAAANSQGDECLVARDMLGCLFYKNPNIG